MKLKGRLSALFYFSTPLLKMQEIFAYIYERCIKNVSPVFSGALDGEDLRVLLRGIKHIFMCFKHKIDVKRGYFSAIGKTCLGTVDNGDG